MELARAFRQSPNPSHARAAAQGLRDSISINERLQASFSPFVNFLAGRHAFILPREIIEHGEITNDAALIGSEIHENPGAAAECHAARANGGHHH